MKQFEPICNRSKAVLEERLIEQLIIRTIHDEIQRSIMRLHMIHNMWNFVSPTVNRVVENLRLHHRSDAKNTVFETPLECFYVSMIIPMRYL